MGSDILPVTMAHTLSAAAATLGSLLRRVTPLGRGPARLVTARLLVPGLLAIDRFVAAREDAYRHRARGWWV